MMCNLCLFQKKKKSQSGGASRLAETEEPGIQKKIYKKYVHTSLFLIPKKRRDTEKQRLFLKKQNMYTFRNVYAFV